MGSSVKGREEKEGEVRLVMDTDSLPPHEHSQYYASKYKQQVNFSFNMAKRGTSLLAFMEN